MLARQTFLVLSPYSEIFELVVPANHRLRLLKSLIDFSFIRKEVIDTLLLVDSHAKTLKEKSMHGKASAALRKG